MTPRPHPGTDRSVAGPMLLFRLPDELRRLRSEPNWTGGRRTITLAKQGDLRTVLMALRAGARIEEHQSTGALTVQVLEGRVSFTVGGETHTLVPGDLLAIEPGLPHTVQAEEESAFLLTLAHSDERR